MDQFKVRKEEPMRNYEFTVIFDASEEKTAKGMVLEWLAMKMKKLLQQLVIQK